MGNTPALDFPSALNQTLRPLLWLKRQLYNLLILSISKDSAHLEGANTARMWKDREELCYRSAEEKSICKPKSPVLKDLPIGFNQRIELGHIGPAIHCAGDEEGSREDRADPTLTEPAVIWWRQTQSKQFTNNMSCGKKAGSKNFPGGPGIKNPPLSAGAWHGMLVAQWCPTLCNPMVCSPLGSSVHGILEWVAIAFSRDLPGTQGSNLGLTLLPRTRQYGPRSHQNRKESGPGHH